MCVCVCWGRIRYPRIKMDIFHIRHAKRNKKGTAKLKETGGRQVLFSFVLPTRRGARFVSDVCEMRVINILCFSCYQQTSFGFCPWPATSESECVFKIGAKRLKNERMNFVPSIHLGLLSFLLVTCYNRRRLHSHSKKVEDRSWWPC